MCVCVAPQCLYSILSCIGPRRQIVASTTVQCHRTPTRNKSRPKTRIRNADWLVREFSALFEQCSMVIPLYGCAWLTHRGCGVYGCVCSAPVPFHFCVVLAQGVQPWRSPPCSVTWMYRMPTRNKNMPKTMMSPSRVCMYGHTHSKSTDQPGKVANPARGQLNREN